MNCYFIKYQKFLLLIIINDLNPFCDRLNFMLSVFLLSNFPIEFPGEFFGESLVESKVRMSQDLFVAAVIFTIIEVLVCCCATIGSFIWLYLFNLGPVSDYGGFGSSFLFGEVCTMFRWMCCFVIVPTVLSITLMWLIYNDQITTTNKATSFWLVASIPVGWSIIATIIGCILSGNQKLRADEI